MVLLFVALSFFWLSLPKPLFDTVYSTVLEDRNGKLLGARIADDGQWRFPLNTAVPEKYATALIEFEDRRFRYHPGVDPLAIARAATQNIKSKKIVSGGSTISMQVIRLSRKNTNRTFSEKVIELFLSLRLEAGYSKSDILALYAAHAPFGGNVVGLEAAAWRYFGRSPFELSWAESATLAVLPNSPALIHPGRNRETLEAKRNRLLQRLHDAGHIDELTLQLSKTEPLPEAPMPLPQNARHLLDQIYTSDSRGKKVQTTVDQTLQSQANAVLERHRQLLSRNEIYNAAALIIDVRSGEVMSYIGNTDGNRDHDGYFVDIVRAPRSTGSILKPFLYTLMLNDGTLLPDMLINDIPTQIAGYSPKNFSLTYSGAVPASVAIARSLNVPSVRMLQDFGVARFQYYLKAMGMSTLHFQPNHYGLTLILGGAEGTLWDITTMYSSLANFSNRYQADDPKTRIFQPQEISMIQNQNHPVPGSGFRLNAGSVWATFEAMKEVNRPETEVNWKQFATSRKVAWKTGTSFGFRDGWAVGVTPEYVVGVWVGNAGGEGRPGLVGVNTAGPIMFDLFNLLEETTWFRRPLYETSMVSICRQSGHRAGSSCHDTEDKMVPNTGLETEACPYHKVIHLDPSEMYRAHSRCLPVSEMVSRSWFVLPPAQEWYYRRLNPSYKTLPDFLDECTSGEERMADMEMIYPVETTSIYIPTELDGSPGNTVFEVAHRKSNLTIYWHLNNHFIGSTREHHQLALAPDPGWYTLTLVDENGGTLQQRVRFLSR